ncbi:MAG: hypothetical protein RL630_1537 [Verrucomicrobiota bacterium]|jgi:hypothetical protein
MTFRNAMMVGLRAARANFLPGLLLQGVMACILALYLFHNGSRAFFQLVGESRQELGVVFAMVTYTFSGALLPEIMRVLLFQRGRVTVGNIQGFLTMMPVWIFMGSVVDVFYTAQNIWFGAGNDFATVVSKVLVDQFLYSPLIATPVIAGYFAIRSGGFRREAIASVFRFQFLTDTLLPVQLASWMIWFPGVTFVYIMPPPLQLPFAVLVHTFWVLILTTISERERSNA